MKAPLYIESAVAISAQDSFGTDAFLKPPRSTDRGWFSVVDVPYQDYINPVAIRRMSRILKVSISAALEALRRSGVDTPDAIITGTGRGVVTDMEQFVMDMERLKEATLNPTLFIQSTYNSANGWIAMQSKCQGYNQTYVHRGISFELALQDTAMLLEEQAWSNCVLCGGFDEMTSDHYHIRGKLGTWRKPAPVSSALYGEPGDGTIGGEGAAFFMLCRTRRRAAACIRDMRILFNPEGAALHESCHSLLQEAGLSWDSLGLVVSGFNGDQRLGDLYEPVHAASMQGGGYVLYKHLSGEYDTAAGFGLWLANHIFASGDIPVSLLHSGKATAACNSMLVVSSHERETASVILLQRCDALTHE